MNSDTRRLQRALSALKNLRTKLDKLEQANTEPIAIIGLGCRFPGADNPDAFWDLLQSGGDAIQEIPNERWDVDTYYDPDPTAIGKMYTRYGGFIDHFDKFDAPFFGITPREATNLDPQQRWLLEVSWEALEHAGLNPESLQKTRTGVFVGIGPVDYLLHAHKEIPSYETDTYLGTGTDNSVASGRLSYFLGLNGPCLAVDTACSSALVAVHLAVMSLRNGECSLALAGGVNALLSPNIFISQCQAKMLSTDGRCKTFDASANGYVRSEGCGVVVLKRLSDAVADGDNIYALIRGSAVNQDGRTNGLTAPNGLSQQAVIRQALKNGRVNPVEVSYVETHGSGTPLGDPIEVNALGNVYDDERSVPLMIGTVKTNMGHLEAAAGMAGLIKTVLALQHGQIPPNLHFSTPNPHIPWDELPVTVPTERTPWPTEKRLAGVSSFGFSGTNAHVVLEAANSSNDFRRPMANDKIMDARSLIQRKAELSRRKTELIHRQAESIQRKTEPTQWQAESIQRKTEPTQWQAESIQRNQSQFSAKQSQFSAKQS